MSQAAAERTLLEAVQSARQQHRAGAGAVLDILLREPGCQADRLAQDLARWAGVEMVSAGAELAPDFSAWDAERAARTRSVVLRRADGALLMASEDPWDEVPLQQASRLMKTRLVPAAASRAALQQWLGSAVPAAAAGDLDASAMVPSGPVVAFVDQALSAACERGASDVHFESDRRGMTVKLRLDGVMALHARLDGVVPAQEAISRIKVMAQLDITERRLPQDGRLRFRAGGTGEVDLRVSIMPSIHGEDAVLRLLDRGQLSAQRAAITLDALGFPAGQAAQIRELATAPSGMLLVTGPTGSGKTTTVYAALSEINDGLEKIVTIEDPVEYELPGVLQIPVNERKGLTFAKGLRSILRHDPDRILVGEIRDAETAEIAVQSALTGHLVFTTVHANSVSDIVGRFRHFGIDMFGFMSALNGVVVQRLVRRLCTCAGTRAATPAELGWLAGQGVAGAQVPQAVGCERCQGTGYRGRLVVAEVHEVTDALRDDVTEGAPLSKVKAHAVEAGVEPLGRLAALRVAAGETSLEEVKRVIGL